MKNRFNWFIACIITVTLLLCVAGCQDFLIQVNSGNAIININLDLSKLIKNARNDDTQINGYVLKLFVYDAKNYQEGDREIEKLPLLTQTSNKVDVNGIVKASLEVAIDSTVIFVGKLFTLNENDIESEKPLYAGKSEVFKVQPKDNKVHLVLSREKSEIGFEIELQKSHEHTFSSEWSASLTHHWKGTTCGHNDVMADFTEHSFSDWTTTQQPTEEVAGSKERTCEECNYKETAVIEQLAHTHKFEEEWSASLTYHWKAADCEHKDIVSYFGEHVFEEWTTKKEPTEEETGIREQVCSVCNYKKTEEIEKIPTGFALIKAGTFQMGSDAGDEYEKPVHEVTLTKDFYMGKYEVTQAEYEKYCSYTESKSPNSSYGDGDNYPAYYVSWYDALVYCNKRSIAEGLTPCYSINEETDPIEWGTVPTSSDSTWNGVVCDWNANGYRLPTEAEWEYAARAGDNTVDTLTYSGTSDVNELGTYAWYESNSDSISHEVGTKKANAFGLYDMSGNVYEWCWDWYTSSYDTTTEGKSDPTGALSGSTRVLRGGDWNSSSNFSSVSNRYYTYKPNTRAYELGFRLVRASSK